MKTHLGALSALLISVTSLAQSPTPASSAAPAVIPPARGPALELAQQAARAALDACTAKGFNVSVSVIDSGGVLKALLASDGASPRGVQSSTNKAVTALTFKDATSRLGELAKSDKELADRVAANANLNVRAGGLLLKVNDEIIGAIGVGGARGSENDEACALAGVETIQARLTAAFGGSVSHPQAAAAKPPAFKAHVLTRVQLDTLLAKPEQLLIIDVRRPDELTSIGGFPAYLSIQFADLESKLAWIPKDRTIVTVSNHASRGGRAADFLSGKGFKVAGTIGAQNYEAEGGKLTRVPPWPNAPDAKPAT